MATIRIEKSPHFYYYWFLLKSLNCINLTLLWYDAVLLHANKYMINGTTNYANFVVPLERWWATH